MKFFTRGWIYGGWEKAVVVAYREHVARLSPHLPPDVQALTQTNLHDGLIRRLVLDRKAATLLMELRCGDLCVGYFDLDLLYQQATLTPADVEALSVLALNRARGSEFLYDEVDMEENGFFCHRILAIESSRESPLHEVAIIFKGLTLTRTPRENRKFGWRKRRFIEIGATSNG